MGRNPDVTLDKAPLTDWDCHTPTIMVFSDPPLPRTPDKLVLRSPQIESE